MKPIPIIETKRLILHGHEASDFAGCSGMWANEEVVRYIGGKPSTPPQSWARLLAYRGHWELMGFGYWAVEEKATGKYVGELGFADYKRDITPPFDGTPELGWALIPAVHGKGYATEAVNAAVAWGDKQFGGKDTVCIISPENTPSLRIAEKMGFKELRRITYADRPTVVFRRSATK